ncbi:MULTISPECIES: RagB/SusD family nutrient uptake outer membrane protein [Olivibacter]|uniref:RagB/SusD family nutrient uptake outer membrane protein n=1 Tax=Olivibacter jilunii TaxID=985016 RepID=A0ABW6B0M1_9SPHI|nr:RagB/SusD family nutrient uptake outer membrane protein [Olivibacter sp. UJ_SKK_5.1]MDX3912064.1 RagB/SusD family nutrient uptake outer membrane protein [Pseudosphingobacterium sp.]
MISKIHLKRIILVFALSVSLFSCKNYLDLEPPSAFSENYVFSNLPNARSAVLGVYDRLSGLQTYGSRLSLMYPYDSDEMVGVLNGAAPDNSSRDLSRYNLQATNAQLAGPFEQLYAGVERANICIKNIPAMDQYSNGTASEQLELKRLHGEALTLRAQFYFELIRNWGDLPAPFEPAADQAELTLPKVDRDTIYNRLIADLKTAQELLPWRTEASNDERITKGAAKALRARLALYRAGFSLRRSNRMKRTGDYLSFYQIARDECYELMQHREQHTLNPSFQAVFKDGIDAYTLDPHGEILLEVAMGRETDSNLGYYDGPRFYVPGNTSLLGNGQIRIIPAYFYAFDSLDTRRDVTCAPYYNDPDYSKKVQPLLNMTSGKFRSDWINPRLSSAIQATGLNWPLIRFSDVLLMFAEAENELHNGPTSEAILALQEVRTRAYGGNETGNIPNDKEGFFNSLVQERYLEFGGEGIRKYDLIRWNLIGQKIQEVRDVLTKMKNKVAPYDQLPQYMYYKPAEQEVVWGNSLYKASPAIAPEGFVRVNWMAALTDVWITNVAQLFRANHSELFPIPQTAIDANPNLTQDYGY